MMNIFAKLKTALVLLLVTCSMIVSNAQNPVWKSVDRAQFQKRDLERWSDTEIFASFELEIGQLKRTLDRAPHESQLNSRDSYTEIELPLPNGELMTFKVSAYDIAEQKLLRKFPHIATYKGYNDELGAKAYIAFSEKQMTATINMPERTIYIDPYAKNDTKAYISYDISDHHRHDGHYTCHTDESHAERPDVSGLEIDRRGPARSLYVFRLAVSAAGEFTAYHGGTVQGGLDAVVAIVNRLNAIYENEVSVRFILVGDNDKIIFTDRDTDPFDNYPTNGSLEPFRNKNQEVCDQFIGNSNYDVGHVLGRSGSATRGQGVASIATICNSNQKGLGSSIHANPQGDRFTVNIVAHEMGHQFGGLHTMYHCHNVQPGYGYEPGSGTTIMSYTGICSSPANVQTNTDPYFHSNSIEIIYGVLNAATCAQKEDNGNTRPDIRLNYTNGFYIPVSTPFVLEGSATDAEDDDLTYMFEQYQPGHRTYDGNTWSLDQPEANEPLFRSLPATSSPKRYFPRITRLVSNSFSVFEQLPTYARDMVFRFIVRDNHPDGGGVSWRNVRFRTHDNSANGIFDITSYNSKRDTFAPGDQIELNWNVAGTDQSPINCGEVDIYVSYDSGLSYETLLMDNTPNDGSAMINMPDTTAKNIRFMVKCANNIFFNINNKNQRIVRPIAPYGGIVANDGFARLCIPNIYELDIQTFGSNGYDGDMTFNYTGTLPSGATAEFYPQNPKAGDDVKLFVDLQNATGGGPIDLEFTYQDDINPARTFKLEGIVADGDFSTIEVMEPVDGSATVGKRPTLTWSKSDDANSYLVQVSSDPQFSDVVFSQNGNLTGTVDVTTELEQGEVYFWRVIPNSPCNNGEPAITAAFQVASQDCTEFTSTGGPYVIQAAGTPTVTIPINTGTSIQIDNLNVTSIKGTHTNMGTIDFYLRSETGTEVKMSDMAYCSSIFANFDFGYSDDGVVPLCDQWTDIDFRSKESLSAFQGETGQEFTLVVKDNKAGQGGNITSWAFEICGIVAKVGATTVKNDAIGVKPFSSRNLDSFVNFSHVNYSPNELVVTLVSDPKHGIMRYARNEINAGVQFTVQDILDGKLDYKHTGIEDFGTDQVSVIVTDPGGGFLGTPVISFYPDPDAPSATSNVQNDFDYSIFPNPTDGSVTVKSQDDKIIFDEMKIYSSQGKQMRTFVPKSNIQTLDLSELKSGLYFIQVRSGQLFSVRKIIVF